MNTILHPLPRYIGLLLVLPFFSSSCKKDKPKGPEDYRVTVGNQTFGAYLNGQPWLPDDWDAANGTTPIDVAMFNDYLPGLLPHYNYMWIRGKKSTSRIEVYIPPPLIPGRVMLNSITYHYPAELKPPAYGMFYNYSPEKRYMTNNVVTGYIDIISADTIQRKIEGRFEFEAVNTATNEKIKITNGYFKKG